MVRAIGPGDQNILRSAQMRAASTFGAQSTRTKKDVGKKEETSFLQGPKDQLTLQEFAQEATENAQHVGAQREQVKKRDIEGEDGDYARYAFMPEDATGRVATKGDVPGELEEERLVQELNVNSPVLRRAIDEIDREIPPEIRQMAEQMVLEKVDSPGGVEELENMSLDPKVREQVGYVETKLEGDEAPAKREIAERKLTAPELTSPMLWIDEEIEESEEAIMKKMEDSMTFNISPGTASTSNE